MTEAEKNRKSLMKYTNFLRYSTSMGSISSKAILMVIYFRLLFYVIVQILNCGFV